MAAKTKWTPQQQSAIDARGENILVSAAAGSGKTAVLTERAVQRMLDSKEPIDADRIMVVTFTRAAAAEMKQRMLKKLSQRIEEYPDNKAAKRQRRLLERAVIGTIDSLCLSIVQENKQKLALPASFRMGDNRETEDLYDEAINETLEHYYNNDDSGFKELLSLFERKQGDGSLENAVKSLLGFARSNPFYRDWLRQKARIYDSSEKAGDSVWGKILLEHAATVSKRYGSLIDGALETIENDAAFKGYLKAFEADRMLFSELERAADTRDWDLCAAVIKSYIPERLGSARNADQQTAEYLKALRKEYRAVMEKLEQKVFFCDSKRFLEDAEYLSPRVKKLFELAETVDDILTEKKCGCGIFEFSDLQQLTVELLVKKDGDNYSLTETARQIGGRFDEIMVDEYQDVNAVQDMIINALSNGKNLFMVGDVKQSIYRFRQARPEIFISRSERYSKAQNSEGRLIALGGNFRSRSEIVNAANNIFKPLFSKKVGEICYDENHMLSAMADYPENDGAGMEFYVLEQGRMSAADAAQQEADFAAAKIKELIQSGFKVSDNGEMRPVKAGDIAILLRSTKTRAAIYKEALENAGIEAYAALENGFLDALEVRAVLSFLRAVKNPTDDISLIGAMLSPLFGFTAEQLAVIRGERLKGGFYLAVKEYAKQHDKTAEFVRFFERIKKLSYTSDAADIVNTVIEESGFSLRCCAMENGEQRFSNLLMLIQYAEKFHAAGRRGLYSFLKAVDNICDKNGDLAPAAVVGNKNAVTVTSIHKSKGLEWPVVFVCDAGRDFGHLSTDAKRPLALNSELGFACARRDKERRIQFTTAQLEAVKMESAAGQLSEELRVLYVAVTRAREKLIITATVKKTEETIERCAPEGAQLKDYETADCRNYAGWLFASLGCYGDVNRAMARGSVLGGVKLGFAGEEDTADKECGVIDSAGKNADLDETDMFDDERFREMAEKVKYQIAYSYPFKKAAVIPAKLSVSEITHEKSDEYRFSGKPSFAYGTSSGSEKGTAVHAFMQFCNYGSAALDAERELQKMAEEGILDVQQAKLVDIKAIKRFFESELYHRMALSQDIKREFAFMAKADDCLSLNGKYSADGESSMIQGIADCIFTEDGEAVIVDYKTDKVKDMQQLADRYTGQLALYKEMVGSVLKINVKECIIWSFELGDSVRVV